MNSYFDRYEDFKRNGKILPIPGISIPVSISDKSIVYKVGETRLDKVSQAYYGDGYHGFLIMLANPQFGGLEFDIKNRSVIRIPFPFKSAVERYISEVEKYKILYMNNN